MAIGDIGQPQHANAHASHAHNQPQYLKVEIYLTQHVLINSSIFNRVISWHIPPQYSQATLTGRLGSNACTFISLSYSKLYFCAPETIESIQLVSNTWLYRTLAAIIIGNHFYDKLAGNTGQIFGIQDAVRKIRQNRALGSIHMSAELPASITREQVPSACFPYYFLQARNKTKTACIYIINDKTVAFIPTQNEITVFNSHYHETSGAFLAMAPADAAEKREIFKNFGNSSVLCHYDYLLANMIVCS